MIYELKKKLFINGQLVDCFPVLDRQNLLSQLDKEHVQLICISGVLMNLHIVASKIYSSLTRQRKGDVL